MLGCKLRTACAVCFHYFTYQLKIERKITSKEIAIAGANIVIMIRYIYNQDVNMSYA